MSVTVLDQEINSEQNTLSSKKLNTGLREDTRCQMVVSALRSRKIKTKVERTEKDGGLRYSV